MQYRVNVPATINIDMTISARSVEDAKRKALDAIADGSAMIDIDVDRLILNNVENDKIAVERQ